MTSSLLVSSPNIQGNVGSCTVNTVSNTVSQGLILDVQEVTLTNSCTGQIVQQYQYTDYGNVLPSIMIGAIVIIAVIVFGAIGWAIATN